MSQQLHVAFKVGPAPCFVSGLNLGAKDDGMELGLPRLRSRHAATAVDLAKSGLVHVLFQSIGIRNM